MSDSETPIPYCTEFNPSATQSIATGLKAAISTALLVLTAGCENFTPSPVEFSNEDTITVGEVSTLEIDDTVISSLPRSAPMVDTRQSELGRLLFWDPILSGDRDVACATCHLPELAYSDGKTRSVGVGGQGRGAERVQGSVSAVPRNAQGLVNVVWNGIDELGSFDPATAPMFWDNRAESLKEQALEPILSKEEMRGENFEEDIILDEVRQRLNANNGYRTLFAEIVGDREIQESDLAEALAAFQSTLVANNSPFDRWMRGDSEAMTTRQVSGMQEFVLAGCAACHSGPLFSDFELHVLGTPEAEGLEEPDDGDGRFAFRTPSLRQLDFTAPYFHGGQFATLGQVINNFYDQPERSSNPMVPTADLDPDFRAIPETDEGLGSFIAAFLEALNDPDFDRITPERVPSGLSPGGSL